MKRAIIYLTALALLLLIPAASTGPAPAVELAASTAPTTADGFTDLFAAKQDMTWSGGDQATTVVANGRTYWLAGDTMVSNGEAADGSYPPGSVMVSNRILLQRGGDLVNAMAAGGVAVPDPPTHTDANADHYWPQAGFYANGFLYVLAQRVQADPSDALGFKLTGVEMAKYRIRTDGLLVFVAMVATPSTGVPGGAGAAHIQWAGDAVVWNGYVYAYGFTLASGNAYVAHFSYAARVPVGKVEQPSAWRFWAASQGRWVARIDALNPDANTQPDAVLPSQVSSVRLIGGRFVVAHKPWNGYGDTVRIETAAAPTGPWTEVASIPSPAGTWEGRDYVTYCPQLHPEQALASGKLLVSIAWNGKTMDDTMANADLYKPRFYEVTLP